ncbi:efflux RND transporter periplasmic adaptor subunit [Bosea sp. (in: a-proteobacteria)]|uniref:efflux RND transporter periplasmic adaptor subunit n=1 Tax=Bosea sp. (in: a-proteobacteria) TaxID=1871050 RepID=UPI00260EB236|nr:efflux RND transporter periplasmic adaptor subunit [Bosea sp. (in: a-proteobacteria)]MCO5091202.1 efflux RND transporter periplasmic adaptor subunit [Bosea sp. (in: a-proteobacteria)]
MNLHRILPGLSARSMLAAAGLVAVAAGAILLWSRRPVDVEVAAIERDVPVRVFGLGTTEARVVSKIGFEIGATLAELHADHGDSVAKGQVLARLATGEQDAKVAKARAALLIAEVNIARSGANLEKARAVFVQRQEANRRKQALAGRDIVSQQGAEEAARDEAVAKADVAVAESEVESARAQQTDARAQLQYEETMLRHRTLAAPFDAVVIERHKEPGSVVKAGDPIFTLIAAGSYWGLAYVDEARAGFIEEGQPVEARLRSRPLETFTGRVVRIGLESDRVTEERRVWLRGDNPPARVYLGEQVEFWITVAKLDRALLVPAAAVHGYDGRQGTVWTLEDGRLQRRLVRFRHRTEDARLEVVDGLPANARVVTRLDDALREGRAARAAGAGAS